MGIERGSWQRREHPEGSTGGTNEAGGKVSEKARELLEQMVFGFLSTQRASRENWFTSRQIGRAVGVDIGTTRTNSLGALLAAMAEEGKIERNPQNNDEGHALYRGKEEPEIG